jgi:hypothetical protein
MAINNTVRANATGKSLTLDDIRAFTAAATAQRLAGSTPVTGQSTLRQGLKWISVEGAPPAADDEFPHPLTISLAGAKQDVCNAMQVLGLLFNLTVTAGNLSADGVYTATVNLPDPSQQFNKALDALRNGAK